MNKLTIYNLSVTLETSNPTLQQDIYSFLYKYYTIRQVKYGTTQAGDEKVFFGKIKDRGIYQFHSSQFVHLYHYLKELERPVTIDEKVDMRDYVTKSSNMSMRENWVLRENQVPAVEFLTSSAVKSKLLPLQTGMGKGIISLAAIANLKKKVAIVVLARFSQKWIIEIAEKHNTTTKEVMAVQGSSNLRSLINLAKEDTVDTDYFVFNAETIQSYITSYEQDPEKTIDEYGCSPMELFPLLGIGIMINDESHMSFHLLYRTIIYTNVEYQIGLTATLISDDATVRRMHKVIYPESCVYQNSAITKYTDVYPIAYSMNDNARKHIKTTPYGSKNYSHLIFEQSILRKEFLLRNYYKLIKSVIEDYYIQDYMDKDKLMIFVSTVDLATKLTSYLGEYYPEKVVKRYCQEDSYEDMLRGDIIVTTIISAGTGLDVKDLRVCIQTVSVSSSPSNVQSMGRLRKLPDRDVKFCYIYCENLIKQKQYHIKRLELFKEYAQSICLRRSRVNFS